MKHLGSAVLSISVCSALTERDLMAPSPTQTRPLAGLGILSCTTAFCLVVFSCGAMEPGDECWVGSPGCPELVRKGAWYHKALAWGWLGSSARCKFKPEARQNDVKNAASQNTSSYENALIFQHFVPSHNGNKYENIGNSCGMKFL